MKKITLAMILLSIISQANEPIKIQKESKINTRAEKKSFSEVNETQLSKLIEKGVPLIDVRTPQEWKNIGIIKGAHKIMFFDQRGEAHAKEWMQAIEKLGIKKDTPFVIYCAHANRTKAIGSWLTKQMGFANVMELTGGIEYGWIDKGLKVTKK